MQAFVSRSYLTPVRDEEAESQRKAKSRHARQTRRLTQGMTPTDLKEAQKISSLEDGKNEDSSRLEDRSCLRMSLTDDRRVQPGVTEYTETTDVSLNWSQMDEEGNFETRLEILPDLPHRPYCNSSFRVGERWWRDENQNIADSAQLTQQRRPCFDTEGSDYIAKVGGKHLATLIVILRVDLPGHKLLQPPPDSGFVLHLLLSLFTSVDNF
ncbi:protein phosphatase 1 regulatory subunit 12B-like [Haplochromis burtoni]|uniref:protein phosphatase 1 regulatory subunit 12B-like n=1 Tax=Haplochromis burtoni TaxID=8153 RepID=UPI001C2DD4AC|nr:protein phosphatase 1 regulatory subunit 12B-like [Haplochromis burtoni]